MSGRTRVSGRDILRAVVPGSDGYAVRDLPGLTAFAVEDGEPYTYVVGLGGWLRLAPRRSEHMACAGGGAVLGAGEVSVREEVYVCVFCEDELPLLWNVAPRDPPSS
ncbi:hypothetical protein [Streptomyces sp. DSM 15324]|uniref:hypothetical protein n=1 Tax=Streptomyces sp. DSM 15324 TaxID=1739111 RepID=UPI0007477133|nr:hypothetical protein [Streptomyces sp. DSM 15324]KUO07851.1 hypothetical protein AQJ58_33380 [Streptomyces sp. DSM 15324]